ncbi:WXG100 family type VII secretion target [Amycolatopsis sp. SID8362]|uniref:WXG100 family type VII secretion target n=1 Tax=Amycolatopsis sp. SID8362 TaxID=2690346 RepID=UPI0013719768|nr:WXG100 family type VII secretion target [Amycolatopsis sp. SID8362]NBH04191.1 endo-1,4-beta-glucanase [Amycolatopsis sp. SID8362]NED40890.1 WXG100 family type VII secretion target [Amycolatopsis sp. SID8362]
MIAESSTESIPHPLAKQQPVAVAVPQGEDITAAAEPYLGYLTDLSRQLGVLDPVETYFRPLIGRWADLGAEADRLRQAASVAAEVSARLDDQLGRLDAGWEGRDADSFVAYIREIGAAGGDLQEALNVLAGALDELVESVRHVVVDLVEVLVDAADLTSETMLLPSGGARRARAQLEETQESAKALYETARDVMEAFDRLCQGVDDPDAASRSIEIRHRYPQERFKLHDGALNDAAAEESTTPSSAGSSDEVTSPSSAEPKHTGAGTPDTAQPADTPQPAPDHAANQSTSSGVPMMPMMGFGAFGGGGGGRRQPKTRPVTKTSELLGEPGLVAPPVIGEDEKPAQEQKKPPAQ